MHSVMPPFDGTCSRKLGCATELLSCSERLKIQVLPGAAGEMFVACMFLMGRELGPT